MTSYLPPKCKSLIAADTFETLIERQFVNNQTVYILDDGTMLSTSDGVIETSSI